MMQPAEWTLPWPPTTTNNLYVNIPGRGRALDADARDWKMAAAIKIRSESRGVYFAPRTRLALALYLSPPKGSHSDTSNCIKLAEDAVFLGLNSNDYWVVEVHAYRGAPCEQAHIDVVLEPARWRSLDEVRQ